MVIFNTVDFILKWPFIIFFNLTEYFVLCGDKEGRGTVRTGLGILGTFYYLSLVRTWPRKLHSLAISFYIFFKNLLYISASGLWSAVPHSCRQSFASAMGCTVKLQQKQASPPLCYFLPGIFSQQWKYQRDLNFRPLTRFLGVYSNWKFMSP